MVKAVTYWERRVTVIMRFVFICFVQGGLVFFCLLLLVFCFLFFCLFGRPHEKWQNNQLVDCSHQVEEEEMEKGTNNQWQHCPLFRFQNAKCSWCYKLALQYIYIPSSYFFCWMPSVSSLACGRLCHITVSTLTEEHYYSDLQNQEGNL